MKLSQELWPTLHDYLFYDVKLSTKKSAYQAVASHFRFFINYYVERDLDFNRKEFTGMMAWMQGKGYAAGYLNKMITVAKHIDKFYKLNELSDYTYFSQKNKIDYDILLPHEIEAIANVTIEYKKMSDIINFRQRCLIYLLGTTGCRISEALELKTTDLINNPPHVIYRNTKNGTDRAVPIADFLYEMLVRLSYGSTEVFKSGRGGVLDPQQVNIDLKKRADAAGVEKTIWCHLFRHSWITTMLESGVELSDVSVLAGHTDPKSTMRYKNSQLQYYSTVVMMHPLLRQRISLDILSKMVKDVVSRLVDTKSYQILTREEQNSLTITIQKPCNI